MKILKQYLNSVKMYLPREQKDDIINELSENLLMQMEETEAERGRPLTELEQVAILKEHGDPVVVAGRYGATQRCVTFGRQLIGPALYPIYIWVLWLHWGVTFIIHAYLAISRGTLGAGGFLTGIGGFLIAASIQFACVTAVFVILEFYHRKSLQFWCFHLEHLHSIPRWQSAVGLVLWIVYSLYWLAVPHFPALIFGATPGLELAPVWHTFYWPILLLLLAGVMQRIVNLLRPDWSWLQPAVRLAVNAVSLALLYFLLTGNPYVRVTDAATATPEAEQVAFAINKTIYWVLVFGFGIYWFIGGSFDFWFCIKHARYRLSRRREQPALSK
jgi:hypothetical protein